MALVTVGDIINRAYERSTRNDPGKLATDANMMNALSQIFIAYYTAWALAPRNRDAAMALSELTVIAALTAELPEGTLSLVRCETDDGAEVNIIPLEEKQASWHLAPAMYRSGMTLVSRAQTGDPAAGDFLTLWHIDAPEIAFTGLDDVVDERFPQSHHLVLVLELAVLLSVKDEGRDDYEKLVAQLNQQVALFNTVNGIQMPARQSPQRQHGAVRLAPPVEGAG